MNKYLFRSLGLSFLAFFFFISSAPALAVPQVYPVNQIIVLVANVNNQSSTPILNGTAPVLSGFPPSYNVSGSSQLGNPAVISQPDPNGTMSQTQVFENFTSSASFTISGTVGAGNNIIGPGDTILDSVTVSCGNISQTFFPSGGTLTLSVPSGCPSTAVVQVVQNFTPSGPSASAPQHYSCSTNNTCNLDNSNGVFTDSACNNACKPPQPVVVTLTSDPTRTVVPGGEAVYQVDITRTGSDFQGPAQLTANCPGYTTCAFFDSAGNQIPEETYYPPSNLNPPNSTGPGITWSQNPSIIMGYAKVTYFLHVRTQSAIPIQAAPGYAIPLSLVHNGPCNGTCSANTTSHLIVDPVIGNVAVCDASYHPVPGNTSTTLQPVGVYIPSGGSSSNSYGNSIGLAITGSDSKIYSQNCRFSSSGACYWAANWSQVNMQSFSGNPLTTPPSGILSDKAPFMSITGAWTWNIYASQIAGGIYLNTLSSTDGGWNGWFSSGGSQAFGTPTSFTDHAPGSGMTWQLDQNGGTPRYMCHLDIQPCDTLTTSPMSGVTCSANSSTGFNLGWTPAVNPKLSRQVVRVSLDQQSTLDGSCSVPGTSFYDPNNCKDLATTATSFAAGGLQSGKTYYVRVADLCTNPSGEIVLTPDARTTCNTSAGGNPVCPSLSGGSPYLSASPSSMSTNSTGQVYINNAAGWTNIKYQYTNAGGSNATVDPNTGAINSGSSPGTLTITATGTAPNGATNCSSITPVSVTINSSGSCPSGSVIFSPTNPVVGQTGQASVTSNPSGLGNCTYSILSGNSISLSAPVTSGNFSAINTGNTTVQATCNYVNGSTNIPSCSVSGVVTVTSAAGLCPTTGNNITVSPSTIAVSNTANATVPSGWSCTNFSSSNPGIATVNSSGVVTGVGAGNASISGTCTYGSTSCSINPGPVTVTASPVCPASPGSISISPSSIAVNQTTNAAQVPAGYSGCSFSSSNPGVATVNSVTGAVTGKAAGSTDITAICSYGAASPCSPTKQTISVASSPSFTVTPVLNFALDQGTTSSYQQVTFSNNVPGSVDLKVRLNPVAGNDCNNSCGDFGSAPYNLPFGTTNYSDGKIGIDATLLAPGNYSYTITWIGRDYPTDSTILATAQTTINITVNPPKTYIYSTSGNLNFAAQQNAALSAVTPNKDQPVYITNTGNQTLSLTLNSSAISAWASTVPSNGSSIILNPAGQSGATQTLVVSITDTSKPVGTYTGNINFINAQAGNKALAVNYVISAVPPPGGGVAPQVNLTCNGQANNATVDYGGNCVLAWDTQNTSPTSCTASGDWSGAKNVNGGSENQSNLTSNKTYTLTCSTSGFSNAQSTVNVTVKPRPPGGSVQNTATGGVSILCSNVKITITDLSTTEDGFRVYRSTTNATSTAVQVQGDIISTDIPGTGKTYTVTDPGLSSGVTYYYWVVAYKGALESWNPNSLSISPTSCTGTLSGGDKDIVAINGTATGANNCNGSTDALPPGVNLGKGDTLTFSINLCNTSGQGDVTKVVIKDYLINLSLPSNVCYTTNSNNNCSGSGSVAIVQVADNTVPSAGKYSLFTNTSPNYLYINLDDPSKFTVSKGTNVSRVTFQAKLTPPTTCQALNLCRFQDYGSINYFDGLANQNAKYSTPLIPFLNGQNTPVIQETH